MTIQIVTSLKQIQKVGLVNLDLIHGASKKYLRGRNIVEIEK